MANGAMTKSPGSTVCTADPVASTIPTNSWPIRPGPLDLGQAAVGPEVGAADAGGHDADHGVTVLDQLRVVDVVESDVTGRVENGGSHGPFLSAST